MVQATYDIIRAHGGEVKVESETVGASAFMIQLPALKIELI